MTVIDTPGIIPQVSFQATVYRSGDLTGALDTAAIQAALNAVPSTGGKVVLGPGIFRINASLSMKSSTILEGQGAYDILDVAGTNATKVICFTDGMTAVINSDQVNGNVGMSVRDIAFYALNQSTTASKGIAWVKAIRSEVLRCTFNNFKDIAIDITNAASIEDTIAFCRIQKGAGTASVGYGIHFLNVSDSVIFDNEIAGGGVSSGTAMDSILIDGGGYNHVIGNRCYLDGAVGIHLSGSTFNIVMGNRSNTNGTHGIRLDNSAVSNVIEGNTVVDNSQRTANTFDGISLGGAGTLDNIVIGNRCANDVAVTQRYGIAESVSTNFNIIEGNDVRGNQTGALLLAGANTFVLSNLGFNLGKGLSLVGLDNRSGVTVADGSPIALYPVPAGANQLFDAAIEIDATAFTSGTATYTMTYTENGVSQTIVVTATVINVVTGVRRLIQPDASTNVTVQLTGAFVATVRLSAALMQLA